MFKVLFFLLLTLVSVADVNADSCRQWDNNAETRMKKKNRVQCNAYPKLFGKFMWCDHFDTFIFSFWHCERLCCVSFIVVVWSIEYNTKGKTKCTSVSASTQVQKTMKNMNSKCVAKNPNRIEIRIIRHVQWIANIQWELSAQNEELTWRKKSTCYLKHSTARTKYVSEYEWLKRESMQ